MFSKKIIIISSLILLVVLILPFSQIEAQPPDPDAGGVFGDVPEVPTPPGVEKVPEELLTGEGGSLDRGGAVVKGASGSSCGNCCSDANCAAIGGGTCHCLPEPADSGCKIGTVDGEQVVVEGIGGVCAPEDDVVLCPFTRYCKLEQILEAVINWVFYFALVIAPLMIILGAFLFLTSAGDPAKTTKAKSIIIWAVVGLGVILFSKVIYSIIINILTG